MYLFTRKPLSNTEYNRSDHSIANRTCDSDIIKIPHILNTQDFKTMLAICWCYNFIFIPHNKLRRYTPL